MLDAQQRLANSGYYDAVFLTLDTESPDPQAAPVIAQVREAKLQKLVFGAGLSTDSGHACRWTTATTSCPRTAGAR
jgi:translocation and assembly module TamA